jgi:hypothetical protein
MAMALIISVEHNSCLRQFWQFPLSMAFFHITVIKILLLLWIADKLETCFCISLVFFFFEEN